MSSLVTFKILIRMMDTIIILLVRHCFNEQLGFIIIDIKNVCTIRGIVTLHKLQYCVTTSSGKLYRIAWNHSVPRLNSDISDAGFYAHCACFNVEKKIKNKQCKFIFSGHENTIIIVAILFLSKFRILQSNLINQTIFQKPNPCFNLSWQKLFHKSNKWSTKNFTHDFRYDIFPLNYLCLVWLNN